MCICKIIGHNTRELLRREEDNITTKYIICKLFWLWLTGKATYVEAI